MLLLRLPSGKGVPQAMRRPLKQAIYREKWNEQNHEIVLLAAMSNLHHIEQPFQDSQINGQTAHSSVNGVLVRSI